MMDKQEDSKLMARMALLNGIANGLALVIGMVTIPIISRLLTVEEIGVSSTFISTRNIFVFVVTCCAYSYIHKAMLEFKDEKESYIFSIILFCAAMIGVAFLVMMPFKQDLQRMLNFDDLLFYWLFVSALVMALYSIGNFYCIFHNRYIIVSLLVFCTGPVAQLLTILLSYVIPSHRAFGRVLGLDFTYLVVAVCVVVWMLTCRNKRFRISYIRHTLRATIPIVPYQLGQMILTQCDLLMISYFAGSGKTGIYSMGHTIGFLAFTVMTQVMGAWSPWVYRRLEESDKETVRSNSRLMMLVGTYMTVGLMTVGTELVRLFLTQDYLPCISIIPVLVMATFFQFLNLFLYDLEYYYKKTKWTAISSVTAALLNIVLNAVFIPRMGYMAACYTTAASYFVLLVMNILFCRKLDIAHTYDMRVFVGTIVFVAFYMGLMFLLLDHLVLRYALLVVLTVILFLAERKNLRQLFLGMRG